MNEFAIAYPSIMIWILGALFTLILSLSGVVAYFVRKSFERLTDAIKSLELSLGIDHNDIGLLKDRMQRQETTCEMQRLHCPARSYQPKVACNEQL